MDDLGKLVLFRDVVELGGFSSAAAKRGLNHSTVSKHVKTLERELGAQLLERTSRTMRLTAAGEIVLDHSRRIGSTFEEMTQRLEEAEGRVRGELRVGSLLHVGRHIVQPAITRYLAEYPSVKITLILQDEPLAFYRSALDIALCVGLPAEGTLISRKVVENAVCLAAAPSLLAREGPISDPEHLARYPTVAYASPADDITTWAYTVANETRSVTVHPVLRVTDGNALLDAVRHGIGVGYLSRFAASDDLASGRLLPVLPEVELPPYDPVYVLTAPTEFPSPRIEAFKRCVLRVAKRSDGPTRE